MDASSPLLSSRTVALVGLMGAGKSAIGKRLAVRLGLPFVDADDEIERAAGCSIAEFFERYVGFQVQYHLTQITMDRDLGGLMADVVIDALPADRVTPNVRRNAQLRLVLAWDGKWWRIADWSPRSLLR